MKVAHRRALLAVACACVAASGCAGEDVFAAEAGPATIAPAASAAFVVTLSPAPPAKPSGGLDDTTKTLLMLLLPPLLGVGAGYAGALLKLRQDRGAEREKEREHVRLQVLNPLLIAAEDLLDRIVDIARRRKDDAPRAGDVPKSEEMERWFLAAKANAQGDAAYFARWCNDEGYFALSTLYVTAIYFHHAGTIRRDFPFFDLATDGQSSLLAHLSEIRLSIGGKFGIWEVMQDSLGRYAAEAGVVKNYRVFCEMFSDPQQSPWLNRLLDFYRDVRLKRDEQFANVVQSLDALIAFLRSNLDLPALGYVLDEASFERMQGRVPPAQIDALKVLRDKPFGDALRFVSAILATIEQDPADDFKPTILSCARKLRGWSR